jgi:hypothetical protein
VTHCARVLELLSDGKPHSHHELYALNVIAHSRVAELRKRGHNIACWTETVRGDKVAVYQLLPALRAADDEGDADAPLSAARSVACPYPQGAPPHSEGSPAPAGVGTDGNQSDRPGHFQLTLEAA